MNQADQISQFQGLSSQEVLDRRERGLGGELFQPKAPPIREVLRKNLFTVYTLDLLGLALVQTLLGKPFDALISVVVMFLAILINVGQEVWARGRLNNLASTTRPNIEAFRDGQKVEIDPSEIVIDDVVFLDPGDMVIADGELISRADIEVNEAVITGSTDLVVKGFGDKVLAGSFCMAGRAAFRVEQIGTASYAGKMIVDTAIKPKSFSPLQQLINYVLRVLLLVVFYFSILLLVDKYIGISDEYNRSSIASIIFGLAPSGIFFMILVGYTMGAARIANKGALIPGVTTIEALAQVSTLCLGKIGGLAPSEVNMSLIETRSGKSEFSEDQIAFLLGSFARSINSKDLLYLALADSFQGESLQVKEEASYLSTYGWSAISVENDIQQGTYVLAAPGKMGQHLLSDLNSVNSQGYPEGNETESDHSKQLSDLSHQMKGLWRKSVETLRRPVETITNWGKHEILFAYLPEAVELVDEHHKPKIPDSLIPLCVLNFSEDVQVDAFEALATFRKAGVEIKIISSDDPIDLRNFVESIGLVDDPERVKVISGPVLEALSADQLSQIVSETSIFGQVNSQQKVKILETLEDDGEFVAMVGEDIEDVIPMRKADLRIAMQSGGEALRSIADITLINDSLLSLRDVFREGQAVFNGLLDILKLFLTRIVYILVLIITISLLGIGFPFTGKMNSVISILTVDLVGVVVTLTAPSHSVPPGSVLRRLFHFIVPAGLYTGLFSFVVYLLFYTLSGDIAYTQLGMTYFLVSCGLLLAIFVEPPTKWWVAGDVYSGNKWPTITAILAFVLFLVVGPTPLANLLFDTATLKDPLHYLVIGMCVIVWMLSLRYIWRHSLLEKYFGIGVSDLEEL